MKYIKPEYERQVALCCDFITASIEDNGESSYKKGNGEIVQGNKGTVWGDFSDIF